MHCTGPVPDDVREKCASILATKVVKKRRTADLLRYGDSDKPTLHQIYKQSVLSQRRIESLVGSAEEKQVGLDGLAAHALDAFEHYVGEIQTPIAMAASLFDAASWAADSLVNVDLCKPRPGMPLSTTMTYIA